MGIAVGTAIAGVLMIVLFTITGNVIFIGFTAIGTTLGLGIGAGLDKKYNSES